jgi:predicted enzyme related to lactoylglutathione lyase
MAHPNGLFSWVDAALPDPAAGADFYKAVFGWEAEQVSPDESSKYWFFKKEGKVAAGMGQLSEEQQAQGTPPMWTSYVYVEDIDATVAKAKDLGGTILMEPMQIFTTGRMAYLMDPTGAAFALWEPGDFHGAGEFNSPGFFSWNELSTRDIGTALKFYTELFGWTADPQDMGEGGTYYVMTIGDRANGGMFDATPVLPDEVPAHWGVYFTVDDCDASAEAVEAAGGTVVSEPMDLPGVGRMAVCLDSQGAPFTVMQMEPQG